MIVRYYDSTIVQDNRMSQFQYKTLKWWKPLTKYFRWVGQLTFQDNSGTFVSDVYPSWFKVSCHSTPRPSTRTPVLRPQVPTGLPPALTGQTPCTWSSVPGTRSSVPGFWSLAHSSWRSASSSWRSVSSTWRSSSRESIFSVFDDRLAVIFSFVFDFWGLKSNHIIKSSSKELQHVANFDDLLIIN